jgi:hypothetical protein
MATDRMIGVRHPVTDITFGAFATKRSKKGSSSFATSVGLSTNPHAMTLNSEQMFMKFHAGCYKNPQCITIVDKLRNVNWVLFTGGCGLGVKLTTYLYIYEKLRRSGAIPLPFHTSPWTDT